RMAFDVNAETPVVAPHRAVKGVTGADHARDLGKALLELLVEPVEFLRLVSGEGGVHPHHQAALSFKTKALPFQVAEILGSPASPPRMASRTLSVMIWRMSLERGQPSAAGIAVSKRVAAPRASSKLAMLAQAIRSTRPAIVMRRRRPAL